jgi:hypothetical protein
MLKRILALGITSVAFGSLAFIGTGAEALAGPTQGPSLACTSTVSFQDLQNGCQNPGAMGWQIPPSSIEITCNRSELVWQSRPSNCPVNGNVHLEAQLVSSKACVSQEITDTPTSFTMNSQQFVQVENDYSRTLAVTCNDLLSYPTVTALCAATLKGLAPNWSLVGSRETGAVIDTCGAPQQIVGQSVGQSR